MAEVTRVLIVDDDELFREALAIFLAELPGIEVVGEAADGREAVVKTCSLLPDVVVLDLDMPVLDGFGTARLLRDHPERPAIVICTGAAHAELERQAREAGADAVIRKGRIEDFERALRATIGAASARRSCFARRAGADEQAQQDR